MRNVLRLFSRRRRADPPCVFDPTAPAFVANPYPTLQWLRTHDPVHRSPTGAFVLTRHADVVSALGDSRLGNAPSRHALVNARNRDRYVCAHVAQNILPYLDPPLHGTRRKLVARAFLDHLRSCRPDLDTIVIELLDRHEDRVGLEVVGDLGTPLALRTMAGLFGLPDEDLPQLDAWAEAFFYLFAPIPSEAQRVRLDDALREWRAYFCAQFAARRTTARTDLLDGLVRAAAEAGDVDDLELADHAMLLFADGIENVDRGVGNAVHALLRTPAAYRSLVDAPELIGSAVQECLRFETPGQFIPRIARDDLEIRGVPIRRDSVVLLVIAAANRDPEVFQDPDRFDVTRHPNPHLAFGHGRHACLGGPLVEAMLETVVRALVSRYPTLRLQGSEVSWIERPGHRWIERLDVAFGRE